jgi:hypothetical protein
VSSSLMAFYFIVLWLGTGRWKARYWIERGLKERFTRFCYHILESCLVRLTETGNKDFHHNRSRGAKLLQGGSYRKLVVV